MKNLTLIAVGVISMMTVAFQTASAVPLGRNNEPINYMLQAPDLSRVSAGFYIGEAKRDVTFEGSSLVREMRMPRAFGYVGFDLTQWFNLYAIAGGTSAKVDNFSGDTGFSYGGGVSINLLNHFIKEPVPYEDAFRINIGAQVLANRSELFSNYTVEWIESSAALTFSIVNHVQGNKYYNPESITLYAGPVLSLISSDEISAETEVGVTGGMEIFFTDSMALDLRIDYFDHVSFSGGVNLRF